MVEVFLHKGAPAVGVRVSPGAKRSRVQGTIGGKLKVRVAAPPEAGRANAAVLSLMAAQLGLHVSSLDIVAGSSSRDKVIAFRGIDIAGLRMRLAEVVKEAGSPG